MNAHVEKTNNPAKPMLMAGWLLALCALLGTGLIALVHWHATPYIKENQRQMLLRNLNAVIPAQIYDNAILKDTVQVTDRALLGSDKPKLVYRARKQGKPVALAMQVTAPKGYSGPIELLVGVDYSGRITGVRVLSHKETPGLGDGIDIERSAWIESFFGKSIYAPQPSKWKVKRDGGEFDQLTGATITPRAVVGAVFYALQYYQRHRDALFANSDDPPQNKGEP